MNVLTKEYLFTAHLEQCLDQLGERFRKNPSLVATWEATRSFFSTPGKGLRPQLFLSAWQCLSGMDEPSKEIADVACALEIFHHFALVHDDVIDQSPERRGQPTLHIRLEKEAGLSPQTAQYQAILVGNILYGFAVEKLIAGSADARCANRALELFAKITQDTGMGEALELAHLHEPMQAVTEAEILETYHLKTTRYTFEGPLLIGAILAGADTKTCDVLRAFSRPLGLAFQIKNDLLEIDHLCAEGDPSLAYDLQSQVKTLFMHRLYATLTSQQQEQLAVLNEANLAMLTEHISKSNLRNEMAEVCKQYIYKAQEVLEKGSLPDSLKEALYQLLKRC